MSRMSLTHPVKFVARNIPPATPPRRTTSAPQLEQSSEPPSHATIEKTRKFLLQIPDAGPPKRSFSSPQVNQPDTFLLKGTQSPDSAPTNRSSPPKPGQLRRSRGLSIEAGSRRRVHLDPPKRLLRSNEEAHLPIVTRRRLSKSPAMLLIPAFPRRNQQILSLALPMRKSTSLPALSQMALPKPPLHISIPGSPMSPLNSPGSLLSPVFIRFAISPPPFSPTESV
jgi:hypothetical protein